MKTTQSYNINEIKKLIDLNGSYTNFNLNFKATSVDSKPFKAVVVDQVSLESNDIPDYKVASDGIITGNVKSDSGVYINYYLMLKSDEPNIVDVEIDLTPLPDFESELQENVIDNVTVNTVSKSGFLDRKYFGISMRVIIFLVIAGLGLFTYFKFFKKSTVTESDVDTFEVENTGGFPELSLEDALHDESHVTETFNKFNIVKQESVNLDEASHSSSSYKNMSKLEVDVGDNTSVTTIISDNNTTDNNVPNSAMEYSTPPIYDTDSLLSRIQNLPEL